MTEPQTDLPQKTHGADFGVKNEYDETNDPAVDLLYGPTDLSSCAKAILHTEINSGSGWTQKMDKAMGTMPGLQKALAIWWRFGKEHGEGHGFRVNPPSVIEQHWDGKVAHARQLPEGQWRWWRDGDVLVERPDPQGYGYGPDTRIYYLVERGLTIVENIHLPDPWTAWPWYIHLADIFYDEHRQCWISKDLFCDIILTPDCQRYHVTDLADLGHALQIGLISSETTNQILCRTEQTLAAIIQGHFPFPEIERAQRLCQRLGW